MKLLFGFVAYLAAAAVLAIAVFAGVLFVMDGGPTQPPVLASGTDGRGAGSERARDEARADRNRVPVWIAATPKYDYTPVPADQGPKRTTVIGNDARGAMAATRPRPEQVEAARPRMRDSRRDNDPFFRD